MKSILRDARRINAEEMELPPDLSKLLDSSFVEAYDCLLLKSMMPSYLNPEKSHGPTHFSDLPAHLIECVQDRTGLECFISKTHVEVDGRAEMDPYNLHCAWHFLQDIFQIFRTQQRQEVLRGIVSLDKAASENKIFSCCLRFHVKRDEEQWIANDILNYKEAVLVVDSNDLAKTCF